MRGYNNGEWKQWTLRAIFKLISLYPSVAHIFLYVILHILSVYDLKHMNMVILEAMCWKWQNQHREAGVSKTPHRRLPTKYQNCIFTCKKWIYIGVCVCVCVCIICLYYTSSVQSLSCIRLFVTPWTVARQASLSITNSRSLLKLTSIELVMPSNHITLCHPLLLLPSIFPRIGVFSKESVLRVAKVLEFQLQHQSLWWMFSTDFL